MRRLLSIVFLVACGGGGTKQVKPPEPTPDPIPTTAGPDCKAVAEHLVTVVLADKPDKQAAATDSFRTRCAGDKWTDETRSCFATAGDAAEVDGCAGKLPAAQKDAFAKLREPEPAAAMAPGSPALDEGKMGRKTRGAVPKKKDGKGKKDGADPCQGGEADPCQGGQ